MHASGDVCAPALNEERPVAGEPAAGLFVVAGAQSVALGREGGAMLHTDRKYYKYMQEYDFFDRIIIFNKIQ